MPGLTIPSRSVERRVFAAMDVAERSALRLHAIIDQQFELARSIAMGEYTHVATVDNCYARLDALLERRPCSSKTWRLWVNTGR